MFPPVKMPRLPRSCPSHLTCWPRICIYRILRPDQMLLPLLACPCHSRHNLCCPTIVCQPWFPHWNRCRLLQRDHVVPEWQKHRCEHKEMTSLSPPDVICSQLMLLRSVISGALCVMSRRFITPPIGHSSIILNWCIRMSNHLRKFNYYYSLIEYIIIFNLVKWNSKFIVKIGFLRVMDNSFDLMVDA